MKHQLPAQLSLIHVNGAAASDAARYANAVVLAMVEPDLPAERLVAADQRRRREAQEADGVWNIGGLVDLDQGGVEGDVGAPLAKAGVDDAKLRRHGRGSVQPADRGIPNWRRMFPTSRLLGWKG